MKKLFLSAFTVALLASAAPTTGVTGDGKAGGVDTGSPNGNGTTAGGGATGAEGTGQKNPGTGR